MMLDSRLHRNGSAGDSEGGASGLSDPPGAEGQTAAADGQGPPGGPPQEPGRAPGVYQQQFFSVLDQIVSGTVNAKSQSPLLENRPNIVARLLTLSRRLDDAGNPEALYRQAYFAAKLWKTNPSISSAVSSVIDDIEFSTSRNSPIYTVIRGLRASLMYLSGVGVLLFLLTSLLYARRSRDFLRFTGVLLPFVGAVFASVTCALFASGMINFSFATGADHNMLLNNTYFFIVIGFLAGFSERFTRGLLGTAENAFIATRREERTMQKDGATLNTVTQSTGIIEKAA